MATYGELLRLGSEKREGAERERRLRRWVDGVESGRIRLRNSYLFFLLLSALIEGGTTD
jgi:hypothetical protein